MKTIINKIAVVVSMAMFGALNAAQPLMLPETIVQAKVNVATLSQEAEHDVGKDVIAAVMADYEKIAKRSDVDRIMNPTNIAWMACSVEYSPAMVMRKQKQPAVSLIVEFNKDVDLAPDSVGDDLCKYDRELIDLGFYSCDGLFFKQLGKRLLVASSSPEIVMEWEKVYQMPEALAQDPILPEGVIARVQTVPISSVLERFGIRPYLIAYFENLGDAELGESIAAIGEISLELASDSKDWRMSLEVASEDHETREIVGTIFSSLALSARLGTDLLFAQNEQNLRDILDLKSQMLLFENRVMIRKSLRASHLPSAERLQFAFDRKCIVKLFEKQLKHTLGYAEYSSYMQTGRDLFVAIAIANTEREAAGLQSVWPKSAETISDDPEDIAGKTFETSAAYFEELFDIANYGKSDWMPYVDVDPQSILEGANSKWIVSAGVMDEFNDNIPVLVTSNVNREALNEGRFEFSGEWAVAILKGGRAVVIHKGQKPYSFGPLPQNVRYL